ncbi:hypothetical protein RJ639_011089, partial [Escallonia herrerae]
YRTEQLERTSAAASTSTMIYTAIDTFYLTDEQLQNSPSRKDGIDEATETALRIYGCDLIQESGILLKLPQAVMATGQVLFHRFYCKKSFLRFNVKRVAASCVWLASKLEESPRRARHVLNVFHRMECRRENLLIEHLDPHCKKYVDLKMELIKTERHLLKEMGFICHVEHTHKFVSTYLATLEVPDQLRQEAWNLANDSSLRTTLCVRFKSAVVACGVVYAAARRFHVPLPENPPWWKAFDVDKFGIDEVCRVLAHLYSLPKAQHSALYSLSQPVPKEVLSCGPPANDDDSSTPAAVTIAINQKGGSKGAITKASVFSDFKRTKMDALSIKGFKHEGHCKKPKHHSSRDFWPPAKVEGGTSWPAKELLLEVARTQYKLMIKKEKVHAGTTVFAGALEYRFVLKRRNLAIPALQISLNAFEWTDGESETKASSFCGVVVLLSMSTNNVEVREFVAKDLFSAIIQGLALESTAIISSDLVGLCGEIFTHLTDRDAAPRQILRSLPSITQQDLLAFEEVRARNLGSAPESRTTEEEHVGLAAVV